MRAVRGHGPGLDADRGAAAGQAGEEHYQALFEAIDEGFCIVDVIFDDDGNATDYEFAEVNPAFEVQTGLADAAGRRMRELRPGHEQHWFDTYGQVARTGTPIRFTERAGELDDRWFDVYAFALGPTAPYRVGILFRDVTSPRASAEALREAEERQAFLLELSDALRTLSDPMEVQDVATRLLRDHLDLTRCGYGEVDDAGEVVSLQCEHRATGAPSMVGQLRMADYDQSIMNAFREGRTLVVADVATDPRTADPSIAADFGTFETRAAVEAPLIKSGRFAAILFAHESRPRAWTAAEVALVQDVAERTWAVVARARSDEALRVSDARHTFLLELSDALRPLGDPAEIAFKTAETLGRHLGAARCVYGDFDPAGEYFEVDRNWTDGSVESLSGRYRLEDFASPLEGFRRGETLVIEDTGEDARAHHGEEAFAAIGVIRSVVAVPLLKAGRLTAAVAVHDTKPRRWGADELALVEETAERTWAAVARARAEAALHETEVRARIALDATGTGSFVWYPAEDRGEPDARMLQLFGLEPDATLNLAEALATLIHPDDRERYAAAVAESTDPDGDRELQEEIRVVRPDGEWRVISVFARTELGDDPPRTTRMHGVAMDLTESRRAQEAARAEREDRERRDREFVANAAHELRTPLTGILGAVDALDAGAKNDTRERERFLGHVRRGAERLSRLSESLLLLARAVDRSSLPVELVAVRPMLEDIAGALTPHEGVEVEVAAPRELTVETNAGLLERVLVNLAENAAGHTERGRIELGAEAAADAVTFEVRDTGPSIDPEIIDRVLERFHRGSDSGEGFGLGLAIASQAASAIHGELTLEPADGRGTVARLVLPIRELAENRREPGGEPHGPPGSPPRRSPPGH